MAEELAEGSRVIGGGRGGCGGEQDEERHREWRVPMPYLAPFFSRSPTSGIGHRWPGMVGEPPNGSGAELGAPIMVVLASHE